MTTLLKAIPTAVGRAFSNPILARELKERMRTLRAPVVLTIYLLVLGMVAFATERMYTQDSGFNPLAAAGLGRAVFHFLLFFTLMLICFLVPGFTSSSVTAERERQTFPLLQVTLLRPSAIVFGKLASSLAFLMLLMVATLPLMSISFILGGVSPLEVLKGYGMILLTGVTIAMIGIAFSATVRKTVSATILTYAVVGLLAVGSVISYGLVRMVVERSGRDASGHVWGLVVNPFLGTASAIQSSGASGGPQSPFDSMFQFISPFGGFSGVVEQRFAVVGGGNIDVGGQIPVPMPVDQPVGVPNVPKRAPIWVSTVGWYLGMSVVAFFLAVAGVRAPGRFMLGRRRAALAES